MSRERLFSGLAGILEVEEGTLAGDFALGETNWDSMAMLEAISLIDELFDLAVPAKALGSCRSAGAVWELVRRTAEEAG